MKYILTVSCCLLLASPQFARAGFERGNGGTDDALQFTHSMQNAIPVLEVQLHNSFSKPLVGFTDNDLKNLKDDLNTVKVEATSEVLCPDSNPSCKPEDGLVAKNFPEKKLIRFNKEKFLALDQLWRARMAFHEYLGIRMLEVNDYHISSQLVAFDDRALGASNYYGCQISLIDNLDKQGLRPVGVYPTSYYSGFVQFIKDGAAGFGEMKNVTAPFAWEQLPAKITFKRREFQQVRVRGVIADAYLRLKVELANATDGFSEPKDMVVLLPETVLMSGEFQAVKIFDIDKYKLFVSCSRY